MKRWLVISVKALAGCVRLVLCLVGLACCLGLLIALPYLFGCVFLPFLPVGEAGHWVREVVHFKLSIAEIFTGMRQHQAALLDGIGFAWFIVGAGLIYALGGALFLAPFVALFGGQRCCHAETRR